jgi:hypothetical protein
MATHFNKKCSKRFPQLLNPSNMFYFDVDTVDLAMATSKVRFLSGFKTKCRVLKR